MKRKKFRPLKCINGTKGVIALFLAILMTPFLSVATILVEMGRYNSAVSILDEAMGVSATSTLANYDPFLRERWGLLALSQDININDSFNEYFTTNIGVLGNSVKLNSPANSMGLYPLSNRDTLNAQILEFAKYSAPTRLATTVFTVAIEELLGLIKNLDKFITNILSTFTSVNTTISATKTLMQSSQELAKATAKIEQYGAFYNECYDEFERTVTDLVSALNTTSEEGADTDIESLKDYIL